MADIDLQLQQENPIEPTSLRVYEQKDAELRPYGFTEKVGQAIKSGLTENTISYASDTATAWGAKFFSDEQEIDEKTFNELPGRTPKMSWYPGMTYKSYNVMQDHYANIEDYKRIVGDEITVPSVLGGITAGLADPTNFLPVLGINKVIAQSALKTFLYRSGAVALTSAGIETVIQPTLASAAYKARGDELTYEQMLTNVGMAAGAGLLFGAAFEGVRYGITRHNYLDKVETSIAATQYPTEKPLTDIEMKKQGMVPLKQTINENTKNILIERGYSEGLDDITPRVGKGGSAIIEGIETYVDTAGRIYNDRAGIDSGDYVKIKRTQNKIEIEGTTQGIASTAEALSREMNATDRVNIKNIETGEFSNNLPASKLAQFPKVYQLRNKELLVGLDERPMYTAKNEATGRTYILQEDGNGELDIFKNKGNLYIRDKNNKTRLATDDEKFQIFQDIKQAVPADAGTAPKSAVKKKLDTPLIDSIKDAVPTKRQAEIMVDDAINKNKITDVSEQKIRSDVNFQKLPEDTKQSAMSNALLYEFWTFTRGKDAMKELGLEWDPVNYIFKDIGSGRDPVIKQLLLNTQSKNKIIVDDRRKILTDYYNCKRGS
jgi:hypothetical protein